LNDVLPQALALLSEAERPNVTHQSGEKQLPALQDNYARAGVQATLTPFIADTAQAFAQADLIIGRAGASTVTEIAAVGAAALFVPFPFAVDDHQSTNARYLAEQGGAWVMQQSDCSAKALAAFLQELCSDPMRGRAKLLATAQNAQRMAQTSAVKTLLAACQEALPLHMKSAANATEQKGHSA
jgi:UDP-N-acetylglucosamine--N-acetylmuramyl-(pentapeptide) pyrophosphoryl-undecaprenol N-acetylglucosamine transferase